MKVVATERGRERERERGMRCVPQEKSGSTFTLLREIAKGFLFLILFAFIVQASLGRKVGNEIET